MSSKSSKARAAKAVSPVVSPVLAPVPAPVSGRPVVAPVVPSPAKDPNFGKPHDAVVVTPGEDKPSRYGHRPALHQNVTMEAKRRPSRRLAASK